MLEKRGRQETGDRRQGSKFSQGFSPCSHNGYVTRPLKWWADIEGARHGPCRVDLARLAGRNHARKDLRSRRRHGAVRPVRRPGPGSPAFLVISPVGRFTRVADRFGTAMLETDARHAFHAPLERRRAVKNLAARCAAAARRAARSWILGEGRALREENGQRGQSAASQVFAHESAEHLRPSLSLVCDCHSPVEKGDRTSQCSARDERSCPLLQRAVSAACRSIPLRWFPPRRASKGESNGNS
jgi:hypothetical protein